MKTQEKYFNTYQDLFKYWMEESFKLYQERLEEIKRTPLTSFLTKNPVVKVENKERYEWKLKS